MAKVIMNDGKEAYVTPGEARRLVSAGEAEYDQPMPLYSTRQMTAEKPKPKRKRRTKEQMKADNAE